MTTYLKPGYTLALFVLYISCSYSSFSQTCTLTGSGTVNWDNSSSYTCEEVGTSTDASIIVIPSGMTLSFNNGSDTWTGSQFVVNGTLDISASGQVDLYSDIVVNSGGILRIGSKLNLGSSSGTCDYTVVVEEGGLIDIVSGSGASDRLEICGEIIAQGGGGCFPFPGENLPFCEPTGGFTGPFAFDETGLNNDLLPVELLSFKAVARQNGVDLIWKTATELNNDYFTIERSKNGIEFNAFATVQGYGTTNQVQSYEFTDEHPFSGLSYYRLKQTDFDGTTETFRPVSVLFEGISSTVSIFPNPLRDNELNVAVNGPDFDTDVTLNIFNISGTKVCERTISFSLSGLQKLDLGFLPKGAYVVNLSSDRINQNFKLVRD